MSIQFEPGEEVIFEVRKHWFILATEMSGAFFAALVPAVIYAIGSALPLTFNTPGNSVILFLIIYAFWLLLVLVVTAYFWTDYYLDVWIVTNRRIIDIEQRGLFSRDVATMQLSKIQDITTEIHGLFATTMKFGDLHVQTAGNEREFVIHGVSNPNEVREKLETAMHHHGATVVTSKDASRVGLA